MLFIGFDGMSIDFPFSTFSFFVFLFRTCFCFEWSSIVQFPFVSVVFTACWFSSSTKWVLEKIQFVCMPRIAIDLKLAKFLFHSLLFIGFFFVLWLLLLLMLQCFITAISHEYRFIYTVDISNGPFNDCFYRLSDDDVECA